MYLTEASGTQAGRGAGASSSGATRTPRSLHGNSSLVVCVGEVSQGGSFGSSWDPGLSESLCGLCKHRSGRDMVWKVPEPFRRSSEAART